MPETQLQTGSQRRQFHHQQVHSQLPDRLPDVRWILDPDRGTPGPSHALHHGSAFTDHAAIPDIAQCLIRLRPQCVDDDQHLVRVLYPG